jgi:hypothetical protein
VTSILDVLDTLRPRLPKRWAPDVALRRVRAAAAQLPPGSPVCFLERRFSERKGRVDFGLCYPSPAHEALLNGSKLLARQTPFLWLEVDQAPLGSRSAPAVLLCVDTAMGRRAFGRVVPRLSEARLLALAGAAHQQFLHQPTQPSLRASLRKCFAALPAKGRILHVCFMPSRKPPVTKLNVLLPKSSLLGYLEEIGWSGSYSSLKAIWRSIAPSLRSAKIDLTLTPGVSPKLGLEVHPFNTSVEGRREVLRWLEHEGLAGSQQSAELSRWHGARQTVLAGKPTPIELDFGMKIVLDAESKIDAKGYFQIASESLVTPAAAERRQRKSHA